MNGPGKNGHSGFVDVNMFDVGGFLRLGSRSVRHHKNKVIVRRDLDSARYTFYANCSKALTVLPRQSEYALTPANTPRDNTGTDRSERAGA